MVSHHTNTIIFIHKGTSWLQVKAKTFTLNIGTQKTLAIHGGKAYEIIRRSADKRCTMNEALQ